MSRELTNQQAAQDITLPAEPRVDEIVRNRVVFREVGGKFQIDRELTPPERAHLQGRKQAIARHLRPLGTASEEKRRLALALGALFLGYPSLRTDNAATERISAYVDALSGFPIFAALKAIEAVKSGAVDDLNSDFPPTSVRLSEIAAQYVRDVRRQRHEVEATLEAQISEVSVPPERRKELAQEMLKHSQKIREETDEHLDPVKIKERADEATSRRDKQLLAEYRQHGIEPRYADKNKTMLVSLSMLRKVSTNIEL